MNVSIVVENLNDMRLGVFLIFAVLVWSCTADSGNEISVFNSSYNFDESQFDWSGGVADYPVKDSANVKFDFVYGLIPEAIAPVQRSLKLSGSNNGDYLTMFIKKQITGLKPETDYRLAFDIELACDADDASSETVILKAGATASDPTTIRTNDRFRLTIDKGAYAESGADMIVIDTVQVNATTDEYGVTQTGDAPSKYLYVNVQSDNAGSLWVIIATESSGIGRSTVYYSKVAITFSASNH
jgi:hypothetical protein